MKDIQLLDQIVIIKSYYMKKYILILFSIFLLSSCEEEKEIKLSHNANISFQKNKFDTLLAITGENQTYFFDYESKKIRGIAGNENMKETETITEGGGILGIILIILVIVAILL